MLCLMDQTMTTRVSSNACTTTEKCLCSEDLLTLFPAQIPDACLCATITAPLTPQSLGLHLKLLHDYEIGFVVTGASLSLVLLSLYPV
jgi:hypothetical protein